MQYLAKGLLVGKSVYEKDDEDRFVYEILIYDKKSEFLEGVRLARVISDKDTLVGAKLMAKVDLDCTLRENFKSHEFYPTFANARLSEKE